MTLIEVSVYVGLCDNTFLSRFSCAELLSGTESHALRLNNFARLHFLKSCSCFHEFEL